jgi:uncharacterized protein YpuA (DUF1002 family)
MIRRFTMDWSLNIGNVISITTFLLAGVGAWYDVKTDVKVNHNEAVVKFQQVEAFMNDQKVYNAGAEKERDALLSDIKTRIRDDTRDIKAEIRDLRTEVIRHSNDVMKKR